MRLVGVLLLGLGLPLGAHAADGVIEINQARAEAGGVTLSDAPGFPVSLSEPGSYRLTGGLAVFDATVPVIEVNSSDITINLGGFVLRCASLTGSCASDGIESGRGGAGARRGNVVVRNGIVRGMGGDGIRLGHRSRVEHVQVVGSGETGIALGDDSTVDGSSAHDGGGVGIEVGARGQVLASAASANASHGIVVGLDGVAGQNSASENGGSGILATAGGSTLWGNSASANGAAGINAVGAALKGNTARGNTGAGIVARLGSTAIGNAAEGNGGHGVVCVGGALEPTAGGIAHNALFSNNGGSSNAQTLACEELGPNLCGTSTDCP